MANIIYPIPIKLVDNEGIKVLAIHRYKVLRPLSGEGYSIEYLIPRIHKNGLGGVVSNTLAAIHDELLHEKPRQLNEYDKIILVVRAHKFDEYYDYAKKAGAQTGEFSLVTDNYKQLINPPINLNKMRDELIRLMYRYFNEFPSETINGLSIYCSLNYSISSIKRAIDFLVRINKVNEESIITPDSLYLNEYALNPMIFDELDLKYRNLDNINSRNQLSKSNICDFFICHASEDKDIYVRDLAKRLIKEGFKVWYDEFSLTWGDNLRRSIEKGLIQSKYGIVILSHNCFDKEWPQKELDGLFVLEEDSKKILPIWLNIDYQDVKKYSPLLAGKIAIKSADGFDKVIFESKKLLEK